MRRRHRLLAAAVILVTLTACSTTNPISGPTASSSASGNVLVIGSQQYYSNEIIAEIYAQALEAQGFTVNRQFQIGQREVYLKELEAGRIDILPEYNGNLLQYYNKSATATTTEEITTALQSALPAGLRVLNPAPATDQDSYNVTRATADQYGLTSLADLTKLPQPIKLGGNSELATRPYGPTGLKAMYGVDATVTPIEDSGGPLTVKALKDGTVTAADVYSASPAIASNDLVTLTDPKHMILPQNITPLVSAKVTTQAADVLNQVDAQLTTADLIQLNQRSVTDQQSAATIAKAWLDQKGIH